MNDKLLPQGKDVTNTSNDLLQLLLEQNLNKIRKSNCVDYKNLIPEVREMLDEIAWAVFDPDYNKVIVVGASQSGKTFAIEQFAHNHKKYSETELSFINFPVLFSLFKDQHETSATEYRAIAIDLAEQLNISLDQLCIVTDSPHVAANMELVPGVKVILELNDETYSTIYSDEAEGRTRTWSSWHKVDANGAVLTRAHLLKTINQVFLPRMNEINKSKVTENEVKKFVDYVLKHLPKISFDKKIYVTAGPWCHAINRVNGLLQYSSIFSDSKGVNRKHRVWEKVVLEIADEFDTIAALNKSCDAESLEMNLNEIFDALEGKNLNDLNDDELIELSTQSEGSKERKSDKGSIDRYPFVWPELLRSRLGARIVSQDAALDRICDNIVIPASGINDPSKPLRSMLFLGPTGVGKTQVTLEIAKHISDRELNVIRLDMGEYTEKHEVAKLFGAPPGYVGYDEGGQLTSAIKADPNSIILLDEVEKAHPDVWKSFLQILDAGRMTDNHGTVIDFSNTIIIMTSNLGIENISKNPLGFGVIDDESRKKDNEKIILSAVERHFRPEFINRLDDMIVFNELDKKDVSQIIHNEIDKINERIAHNKFMIGKLSPKVVDYVIEKSDVKKYGAREIQRVLQKHVALPVGKIISDVPRKEKGLGDMKTIRLGVSGEKIKVVKITTNAKTKTV